MFTGKLSKTKGKLVYSSEKDKQAYKLFIEILNEGDEIEVFMSRKSKKHSLAQLAKVHSCIRTLAIESGYSFDEMKKLVKQNSGLVINNNYKSFKNCDIDELGLAIQACIQIGEVYNINLS